MSRPITSLTGFVGKLSKTIKENPGRSLVFRGHSKTSYEFLPSVFRTKNHRESEHLMLRQILSENPSDFINDVTTFDKLVRAQHYSLPTRLLDVSTNPLVALYFACAGNTSEKGRVITIIPEIAKQKYFDSDSVSMMSNLALLSRSDKEALLDAAKTTTGLDKEERVKKFCSMPEVTKLLRVVRQEKPHFEAAVDPWDLAFVASVTPRKIHSRIKAQSGAFLLFGLVEGQKGNHLSHLTVEHVDIDAASKKKSLTNCLRLA